jgi:hypothetical protein
MAFSRRYSVNGESVMKSLISILAITLAVAFTGPTFAGGAKTKAECEKAGGTWDAQTYKCSEKKGY